MTLKAPLRRGLFCSLERLRFCRTRILPRASRARTLLLSSSGTYAGKSQLAWSRVEPCGWVCTPTPHRARISTAARPKLVVRFDAPVRKHVTS